MASLTFFTCTGDFLGIVGDSFLDGGINPDTVAVRGKVTFTPLVAGNDGLTLTALSPRPAIVFAQDITGVIDTDGQLKYRGQVGVRLVADTDVLELSSPLFYRVTVTDLTVNGAPRTYSAFNFQAAQSDTPINLATVARVPGQPASGIVNTPLPDHVRLNVGGELVFSANGIDIPDPLAVVLPVSVLSDATPFTKGFLTSVHDAAEARTEIGVSLVALDDIVWYANSAAFPGTGVVDEVYGARDTGKLYLWTGSSYVAARASVTSTDITDSTAVGRSLVTAADAASARTALAVPGPSYASITALRAATAADGVVRLLGYYSAGDGGGGAFRWDATDTTSTDNGGTIITPTSGLSASGRWKRVYEGEVNARWFGVTPDSADCTAALQKAVDWVSRAYPTIGGTVFIPMGWYSFKFDAGTSGLSTITIAADNVVIRGEGKGSRLQVTDHARPSQLAYFFTISQSVRGQGGGIRDINFYGNGMLKWCIYLRTWRDAQFLNISAFDVHSGILDAEAADTSNYGESILVQHLDYAASAGDCKTQYGVRFRAGTASSSKTWSDCWIENLDIVGCWDTAVVLDGVDRFSVRDVVAANNDTSTNTLDGTSKSGCLHVVNITNLVDTAARSSTGYHIVDGIYLESLQGSETRTANTAVLIEQLNINPQIKWNQISNVTSNGTVGLLKLTDASGFGRLNNTTFRGNRNPASATLVTIGAGVADTSLYLTPVPGTPWSTAVTDAGTRTVINNGAATESILAGAHNSGPNLLMDGSYELDAVWWAQEISPVDTHNTLSSTHAFSGAQSMKWTGATTHYPNVTAAGQPGSDASYGFVKTETGRVYRVSFWVYRDAANTSGGYVRSQVNLAGVGGNDLVNGTLVNQSTITVGTWTHYTSTFTVPSTGTHAPYSGIAPAITILSIDPADQFWVDNVRFDDLTDAPLELLAPPPTGDRTTDSAALQALSDMAQTLGRGTVKLRAGTYAADVVTQVSATQPRFEGQGKNQTQWDGTLKFQGHGFSNKFSGGWFGKMKFVGSHAGSSAVELNGCSDVHWDEVRFEGTYDYGIWFHNELSGDYTELCNGKADFYSTVTTALRYTAPVAGWASFHWSGLTGGSIVNAGIGPAVWIESLARPYNSPLTVGVWSSSSAYPVIQHDGAATSNFHGALTVEQSAVSPLAAGNTIYHNGTLSAYMGAGLVLNRGTWVNADRIVSVSGSTEAVSVEPKPLAGQANAIVFMGDSITADACFPQADGVHNWPVLGGLTTMIMGRCPSLRYRYNAGVGGDTTTQMVARWQTDVVAKKPSVVHIMGGTNDTGGRVAIATTYANLKFMMMDAKRMGAEVFIGTIPPRNDHTTDWLPDVEKINLAIKSFAAQLGAHVIDYHSVLVDPATGQYLSGLNVDTVHPNTAGKHVMAQQAWSVFNKVLSEGGVPVSTSQYAQSKNLITNSCFLTDTNSDGVPDGWDTTTGSATTSTWSLVNSDSSFLGNAFQVAFTGASTLARYYTVSGWSVGQTLAFTGRYKASVEAGSGTFMIRVLYNGTSDPLHNQICPLGVGANYDTDRVQQFYMEDVVPAGTTSITIQIAAVGGAGTIRFGQLALWALDSNGFVA